MNYIHCNGCPCLNNDYEQGFSCNLGFDSDLHWFIIKGKSELIQAATNCGLKNLEYVDLNGFDSMHLLGQVQGERICRKERWEKYDQQGNLK